MLREQRPVIVVRKTQPRRQRHESRGSWKMAYADFFTAMMAFFMVLWIVGLDEEVRQSIEGYFTNPAGVAVGSPPASSGSAVAVNLAPIRLVTRNFEERRYREIAERIRAGLRAEEGGLGAAAGQVEVLLTPEGLRIELVEDGGGELFFEFGSAQLKPTAAHAVATIAAQLAGVAAPIVVEGHTDAAPFGSPGYSNWELSADRANAARRALERSGLGTGRVQEVRGYADRFLRHPDAPLDKSNRRITILLPYTTKVDLGRMVGVSEAPALEAN